MPPKKKYSQQTVSAERDFPPLVWVQVPILCIHLRYLRIHLLFRNPLPARHLMI